MIVKKLTIRLMRTIYETVSKDVRTVGDGLLEHGWSDTLSWLHSRDAPGTVQFMKYVLCGLAATFITLVIVIALGATVLPAFDGLVGYEIPKEQRQFNLTLANLISFPFANVVVYFLNVFWVFTPGRHSRWREFWLFTSISAVSFGAGLFGGPLLIGWFNIPSWSAQLGFMVTSALVNFACRKFLIFEK